MSTVTKFRHLGAATAALLAIAACASPNGSTGPLATMPVRLHLSGAVDAAAASSSSPLAVTSLTLVVGGASLGSGDQFGCIDCHGNTMDAPTTPAIIDVPVAGGPVSIATEQASPGHYAQAELSLEQPTSATAAPGWPAGATIVIAGSYNGKAFTLPLTVTGSFRDSLTPPVDIAAGASATPVDVTITLPVASWFTSNGTTLDPSSPGAPATIQTNAQRSFSGPETRSGEVAG